MTEWRYWSDGSYPGDCRWLFRTSGYDRQQAYRPHTDSWEDIPQDNGPNWPRTLLRMKAEVTGDYLPVPAAELDEWIAGYRRYRGLRGPFRSRSPVRSDGGTGGELDTPSGS
jgi:hypothetical protein